MATVGLWMDTVFYACLRVCVAYYYLRQVPLRGLFRGNIIAALQCWLFGR